MLFFFNSFKRIVEYTADEHNGFNAVVRREPIDEKIIKKVYEPEIIKHNLGPVGAPIIAPAPFKYAHHHAPEAIIGPAPVPKVYAPAPGLLHKVKPQFIASPQPYYAAPDSPKFFKPIEKVHKYSLKPTHDYEPLHTGVKYLSSPSHYNQY